MSLETLVSPLLVFETYLHYKLDPEFRLYPRFTGPFYTVSLVGLVSVRCGDSLQPSK